MSTKGSKKPKKPKLSKKKIAEAKSAEFRVKATTATRSQWQGRHLAASFDVLIKYHQELKAGSQYKPFTAKQEVAIKKITRKKKGTQQYISRVKRGTNKLGQMTAEQRKEATAKAVLTRAENRRIKKEWSELTHGEKVKRGKAAAAERREMRRQAGLKAWETRKANEAAKLAELERKRLEEQERKSERDRDKNDRAEKSERETTPIEILVDVFLKYGELNPKTAAKMSQNQEFLKELGKRVMTENMYQTQTHLNRNVWGSLKRRIFGDERSYYEKSIAGLKTQEDAAIFGHDVFNYMGGKEFLKFALKTGIKQLDSNALESEIKTSKFWRDYDQAFSLAQFRDIGAAKSVVNTLKRLNLTYQNINLTKKKKKD